jgi:hypothetical protein
VVLDAVHADLRFPQYRLGPVGADLEIDLATNLEEDDPAYFTETGQIIKRRVAQIGEQIARGDIAHISLFAFARIPVLVQLGHHLDDKWPMDLHQFDRVTSTWNWIAGLPTSFAVTRVSGEKRAARVTLILSLSGHVDHNRVPTELTEGAAVYEMSPVNADPSVNLFRVRDTLTMFTDAYLAFLSAVERDHPRAEAIDVVPSLALTPAIELGRRRTRSKHPVLRIWDLDSTGGGYSLATEVGGDPPNG